MTDNKSTEYIHTRPDLMNGKKILYVHGFASSGQSGTVTLLRTLLPSATVIAPDLPIMPEEAMALLNNICEEEHPDLIIGSSMGGMMTEMLKGYDRILVNPAFQMGDTMTKHGMMGKMTFQNPRRDGIQEMIITKSIVKEYKALTEKCFGDITKEEDEHVFALFGDNDPVVHTRELFLEHYTQGISFHGEHRLIDKVVHHSLVPVVRWIDDRQNGHQREVIYIDIEALRDSYGKARSSAFKAYEALLDNYEIFIVAPASTNHTERCTDDTLWAQDIIGVPAHDHMIFTNKPQLLYGDFYISPTPPADSMATTIEFGSDTFKTWEEIITYFDRLKA